MRKIFIVLMLTLGLFLTGCDNDKTSEPSATPSATSTPSEDSNTASEAPEVNDTGSPTDFILTEVNAYYKGAAEEDCSYYAPGVIEVFYGEVEDAETICNSAQAAAVKEVTSADLSGLNVSIVKKVPEKRLNADAKKVRAQVFALPNMTPVVVVHLTGEVILNDISVGDVDTYYYVKKFDGHWKQVLNFSFN